MSRFADATDEELLLELMFRLDDGEEMTLDMWSSRVRVERRENDNVRVLGSVVEKHKRTAKD